MSPRFALTFGCFFIALTAGCGSPIAPIPAPQIQSATAPAPPPASPQSAAVLTIEQASVKEYAPIPGNRDWGYVVSFLLRETGGTVGAQIEGVKVASDQGADETGPSCWITNLRVPPGGTLDIFYTGEGLKGLGYCAPSLGSTTPLESVRLIVAFQGEDNPKGTVETVIPVRRSE